MNVRLTLCLMLTCLLVACGSVSERSWYEGIRSIEKAKSAGTPEADSPKQLPNYDQYEQDRQTLKKDAR